MGNKIKIGQIGLAHAHGEGKMLAVRKFPELFEVVGICEDDDEVFERRGNLEAYRDLPRMSEEELLSKVDAVLVECSPKNLTQTAKRCIEAGKHIHLDKPTTGSVEEYTAIIHSAKEQELVVQLGYMYRYNPAIMKSFEIIKNGGIGTIHTINAEMSTHHYENSKVPMSRYKGGTMFIMGSHLIDLVVYLLGEPENVSSFFKKTGYDGIEFEDNNLVVLEYEKAIARIYASSVEVNGWGRRQFVVCGETGTISILPIENDVAMTLSDMNIAKSHYADMKEAIDVEDIPKDSRYDTMVQDFAAYIKGEKINPFTYEHEIMVHKVLVDVCGEN